MADQKCTRTKNKIIVSIFHDVEIDLKPFLNKNGDTLTLCKFFDHKA